MKKRFSQKLNFKLTKHQIRHTIQLNQSIDLIV